MLKSATSFPGLMKRSASIKTYSSINLKNNLVNLEFFTDTNNTNYIKQKPLAKCPGFSCNGAIGKCLPTHRRCDKNVDCLDAEDETDCQHISTFIKFSETTANPSAGVDTDQNLSQPPLDTVQDPEDNLRSAITSSNTTSSTVASTIITTWRYPPEIEMKINKSTTEITEGRTPVLNEINIQNIEGITNEIQSTTEYVDFISTAITDDITTAATWSLPDEPLRFTCTR